MWGNKCKCNTLWYAPMNSKIQIFPTEVKNFKRGKICLQKCEITNTKATIHDMLWWIQKSKYFPPNLRLHDILRWIQKIKKFSTKCKKLDSKLQKCKREKCKCNIAWYAQMDWKTQNFSNAVEILKMCKKIIHKSEKMRER